MQLMQQLMVDGGGMRSLFQLCNGNIPAVACTRACTRLPLRQFIRRGLQVLLRCLRLVASGETLSERCWLLNPRHESKIVVVFSPKAHVPREVLSIVNIEQR